MEKQLKTLIIRKLKANEIMVNKLRLATVEKG